MIYELGDILRGMRYSSAVEACYLAIRAVWENTTVPERFVDIAEADAESISALGKMLGSLENVLACPLAEMDAGARERAGAMLGEALSEITRAEVHFDNAKAAKLLSALEST